MTTSDGPVRGFNQGGVNIFLGIPYAAPPVGNLRWQPPQPVKRWHGVLDATKFANTCPQVTELGAFAGPSSTNEDCLYLNVFTTGNKGKKKPVIVWIHGGGNVDGETNDYDASKLATGGPMGTQAVVVTLNYRLGLFGFLSESHLNSEGHLWGNYGILDQQAVLRWVRRNIASFGGDPTKVALGGQSAGAQDTGANVLSPLARGLFNRAIYQSGPLPSLATAALALSRGNAFAAAANCSNSSCLRKLSAERILQLQGTPNANGPYITGPFVDGSIIPIQPEAAWTSGNYNKMPTMGGRVKDEGNFGISITEYFSGPPQTAITEAQYEANVTNTYGANAAAVLAQYPVGNYGNDPQIAYDRVTTDPGKCQALHVLSLWAPVIPTYSYDFTYQNTPYYFPQMPNVSSPTGHFRALAYHTSDIQFVFKNWHGGNLGVNLDQTSGQPRELQGTEIALSDQLVAAWTNFANTGNPNGTGNSPWPKATTGGPFLQQDIPLASESTTQYRANYKCDFWDPLLSYPM
ncbi:carboxylesterase/lipase family protein [Hyphomicrobium sp. DY-1]|uniref:carboxylesterase/lipase family protein n=1 Tax=Hyphomicrobium sp. DY-1 TaxID=3075650 RepID=UPI0039C13275